MKSNFLGSLTKLLQLSLSTDSRGRVDLRRKLESIFLVRGVVRRIRKLAARLLQHSPQDYVSMQKKKYEQYADADRISPGHIDGDYVVGVWKEHDQWKDYEDYLMKHVDPARHWLALEYGCGPGRNMRKWVDWFARIDGVDISEKNLSHARIFLTSQIPEQKQPRLFPTGGMDCGDAPSDTYDFAFSTICLQHICVYDVRLSILRSLFRCLKPGGRLSVQMGYGVPSPLTVGYDENYVQAEDTNRSCDVAISRPEEVQQDLASIGFDRFEYWIRPVGPGDMHPNWIFFTAVKPTPAR